MSAAQNMGHDWHERDNYWWCLDCGRKSTRSRKELICPKFTASQASGAGAETLTDERLNELRRAVWDADPTLEPADFQRACMRAALATQPPKAEAVSGQDQDAARYRWLRARPQMMVEFGRNNHGPKLDDAIDAALGASPSPEPAARSTDDAAQPSGNRGRSIPAPASTSPLKD